MKRLKGYAVAAEGPSFMGYWWLMVLLLPWLASCGASKSVSTSATREKLQEEKHRCDAPGVLELSPECGVVLRLKGGTLLQIVKIDDSDFSFIPDMHVWVSVEKIKDLVPSCEGVTAAVRVSCIEEVPDMKVMALDSCQAVKDVLKVDWMKNLISKYDPSLVARYQKGSAYVYSFEGKFGKVVYDCYGQLFCRTDYGDSTDCDKKFKHLGNREVLLKIDY